MTITLHCACGSYVEIEDGFDWQIASATLHMFIQHHERCIGQPTVVDVSEVHAPTGEDG